MGTGRQWFVREAKSLALDFAIRDVKKADWRGNTFKEREVRNAIKSELGDDDVTRGERLIRDREGSE